MSALAVLLGRERETVVLVAFSDESDQDSGPIVVVSAVIMNMDSQWPCVGKAMNAIQPGREIKGQPLFKDLRNGRHREKADKKLSQVVSVVTDNLLPVFPGTIQRAWFDDMMRKLGNTKTTAYEVAFALCLHRVDMWMHTIFPKEQVVWISDDAGKYEKTIPEALAVWRQNADAGLSLEQMMPQALHIADTIFYGSSKRSRSIQIADVCCSVLREYLAGNPDAKKYYDHLAIQLQHSPAPYPYGVIASA